MLLEDILILFPGFSHDILGRHEQWIDILEAIELGLVDLVDGVPEKFVKTMKNHDLWNLTATMDKNHKTYGSSGVSWTGSSVNSGGKLARSFSDSNLGRYGGGICFCSSWNKNQQGQR